MRRTRTLTLLACLAATLVAGACGRPVQEPEVRLSSVRLGSLGFQGGVIHVELDVTNPNRFAFEADGLTYDLAVLEPAASAERWARITTGSFDENVRVGARETRSVEIPVAFRFADAGGALRTIMGSGSVDYRLSGSISLVSPVRRQIPYQHLGTFSLDESTAANP